MKSIKILCIVVLIFNTNKAKTQNSELIYLHQLQNHRTSGKNSFYRLISSSDAPICFLTTATFFAVGKLKHNPKLTFQSFQILESQILNTALTYAFKLTINRPRPAETDPTLFPLSVEKKYSFPSGHTSIAFSTATSLSILYPKAYIYVPAYTFATLVGFSRMYMGVHYPSDVIAGALLGSGSAWLSIKLNKIIFHPKKNIVHLSNKSIKL